MRMAEQQVCCEADKTSRIVPIRVAVVEDTQEVREGLSWLLGNSEGFNCVGAYASGEDAIRHLPGLNPDVVLMDIDLPGMSGVECLGQLKALCPEVQVSMLTVFEDEDRIFRSLTAGASGYLLKSTTPAGILKAVRDLRDGGSPMSSQVARKVLNSFLEQSKKPSLLARLTSSPQPAPTGSLSERERQILELLAKGHMYKEIADELGISIHTVRTFIRRMYEKLHVHSRTEALLKMAHAKEG